MDKAEFHEDIEKLYSVLPESILQPLKQKNMEEIIEIVMDLGRLPEIRKADGKIEFLSKELVTQEQINYVSEQIEDFASDNRSGIAGTLHRISAIKNRKGKTIGLTCRVGRVVTGTILCIKDIVLKGKSILFLGRPGVGKTTKLREIARTICQYALTRLNTRYKTDTDKPFVAHNLQEFYDTYKPVFKLGLTKECLEQLFEEFAKNFKENA